MFKDTSIFETKIRDRVSNMCLEAIVSEAFIESLPINKTELDDGLAHSFAKYATECMEDLGSFELLREAMESTKEPAKKAYLKRMHSICMETANTVTNRIIEEASGDQKALEEAAKNVTLTPEEYARFSKAAATLTPASLTDMIRKKTLDTIKEEKEAYKRDSELTQELTNALAEAEDEPDDSEQISTESPDDITPNEEPTPVADNGGADATGADIGTEAASIALSDFNEMSPATEGFKDFFKKVFTRKVDANASTKVKITKSNEERIDVNPPLPKSMEDLMPLLTTFISIMLKNVPDMVAFESFGIFGPRNLNCAFWKTKDMTEPGRWIYDTKGRISSSIYKMIDAGRQYEGYKGMTAYRFKYGDGKCSLYPCYDRIEAGKEEATMAIWMAKYISDTKEIRVNIQNHGDPTYECFSLRKEPNGTYAIESHFVDVQNESQKNDCHPTGARIGQACCGGECAKPTKDPKKAKAAFEAYMRALAGDGYRANHSSVFSKIQELAYEGICATTESFSEIPFETMTAITKENTFSKFNSHSSKSIRQTIDSISRYAFESAATPDAPDQKTQLSNALLTASIIYTFFETLNSMNLYCPKLAEIRRFVDETLPIEGKVMQDKQAFENLFKSLISKADANVQKAMTVPELDSVEKDLDIVRERATAPGFESMKDDIIAKIDALKKKIDIKRDHIVEKQRPTAPAVESSFQTMQRTRDTLKFSRVASTMGCKPNVAMVKCKVDPQKNPKYVAIECYTANNRLANTTSIVLESALASDVVSYVTGAVNSSKLVDLDKRIMISDARSGKVYMDTAKK